MNEPSNATLHSFPREREESPCDLSSKGLSAPIERGSDDRESLYASLYEGEPERESQAASNAATTSLLSVLGQIERLACGHLPQQERDSAGAILLDAVRDWLSGMSGEGDVDAKRAQAALGSERESVKSISETIARREHELETLSARRRSPDGVPRARVLVVDADPIATRITLGFLSSEGYAGVAADTGKLALERLEKERFDAILIDPNLAGLDGYQFTAAVRVAEAERSSQHLAIIAVMGEVGPEVRRRCLESGMNAYLCKPLRQGDLDGLLQTWVPEDRSLEPS